MTNWQACRLPRIEPVLKPEVLHSRCRLDEESSAGSQLRWFPLQCTTK